MKRTVIILYLALLLILFITWEWRGEQSNNVRILISSPGRIFNYFIANNADLLHAAWTTFYESILGLLIAISISFASMICCFYFPHLIGFLLPVMIVSQVIPLITLAPLFIILFGAGPAATITMAALLCYFPIFLNFAQGYKLIDKNVHDLALLYKASRWQTIRYVYFPMSMPNIMAGLKIASTLAVIGAIVAEFSGAEAGLGRNLYISALRLEPELMMSSLFLSAILGGFMYGIIYFIEHKIGKWYLKKNM